MSEVVEVTAQQEITVPAGRALKGEKIYVPVHLAKQLADIGAVTLSKAEAKKAEKD